MYQPIDIESERLLLKKITPATIHHLFTTSSQQEIMQYFGCPVSEYQRLYEMHTKGMETDRLSMVFFILIDKTTGMPIGQCGFHTWNATHRRAELFYHIHNEHYKRQGLMTEALARVLTYGYTHMNLHRIAALVAPDNLASIRLLRHYRFIKEGVLREDYCVNGVNEDSICYSLLRHEWDKT